jgi:hypothetical protein
MSGSSGSSTSRCGWARSSSARPASEAGIWECFSIVVTAYGEEIRADELGVQAILTKPFDLDRLVGKLTSLLA